MSGPRLNLTTNAKRAISQPSHDGPSAKRPGLWLAGKEDWLVVFRGTGDVHAQLGTQLKTLVNKTQFRGQFFEGRMMGDIGTQDASRYPHHLYLDLKQREEVFTGAMIAIPIREKTPGKRFGMALSSWVEVRKDH